MSFTQGLKRRAKAALAPIFFSALFAFFNYHTIHGTRGTNAREIRRAEIIAAQATLAEAEAERDALERRVASMRAENLDRDLLEERARAVLNVVQKTDIIVPYAPTRRLY